MARKRTPEVGTTTESQSPPTAPATTQPEDQAPPTATAVLEPPAAEPEPTFVEKLARQRQPGMASDPFAIAGDAEAGVRLFENRRERLMVIKFERKPNPGVLDRLKDSGFRWNPRDQVWVHPIYEDNARRSRIEAERTYQDVRQMIRLERGLDESLEIPF